MQTIVELNWQPDSFTLVNIKGGSAVLVIEEAEKMMKFTAPKIEQTKAETTGK